MFRVLFFSTVFVTLVVNIILLFATKDKPPDPASGTTTLVSVISSSSGGGGGGGLVSSAERDATAAAAAAALPGDDGPRRLTDGGRPAPSRRLFLRSNDFYDYSPAIEPAESTSTTATDNDKQSSPSSQAAGAAPHSSQAEPGALTPQPTTGWLKQSRPRPTTAASRDKSWSDTTSGGRRLSGWQANAKTNDEAEGERAGRSRKSSNGENPAAQTSSGNEITRPGDKHDIAPMARNTLAIRVKSSKNHVLIKVDNLIIYESGSCAAPAASTATAAAAAAAATTTTTTTGLAQRRKPADGKHAPPSATAFSRRPRRARRLSAEGRNANPWAAALAGDTRPPPPPPPQTRVQAQPQSQQTPEDNQGENQLWADQRGGGRGLHVLVLNQFEGFVMSKRLFDTYLPQQDDELAYYLSQIQDGRLVVMAVQDEASFKMARSSRARQLIQQTLGSRSITELAWRDMWALVGRKRQGQRLETNLVLGGGGGGLAGETGDQHSANPLAEAISKSPGFADWGAPLEISANVSLLNPDGGARGSPGPPACRFPLDKPEVSERRCRFCARIEGYGRLCDPVHPSRLEFVAPPMESSQLLDVPVAVIASDRPYYLYRMLRSLLETRGVRPEMVTVFIDGFYDEPREICKLLNLRYVQNKPLGSRSARISHHYKASLAHIFERLFPRAPFSIVLEEDLDVARDALVLFNQTRHLLEADPSLYCVSAWNDQGYEHSVGNLKQLMRVETMPGLGWMLSRRLFMEELKDKWPPVSQQHDWDMWIRTPQVRRGRECIIPDVSRTYHFGSTGTNINSYFQSQYFAKHALSDHLMPRAALESATCSFQFEHLDQMTADNYERLILNLLQDDESTLASSGRRRWISAGDYGANSWTGSAPTQTSTRSDQIVVLSRESLCALATNASATGHHHRQSQSTAKLSTTTSGSERAPLDVVFIKMIDSEDYRNWLALAKCWRLWDLDARGQHKSMWRLYADGRQTLVLGHPASPYARAKPSQVRPFDFPAA